MARGLGGRRQPLQRVVLTWFHAHSPKKGPFETQHSRTARLVTRNQKQLGDITWMFSLRVGGYTHGDMSTNQPTCDHFASVSSCYHGCVLISELHIQGSTIAIPISLVFIGKMAGWGVFQFHFSSLHWENGWVGGGSSNSISLVFIGKMAGWGVFQFHFSSLHRENGWVVGLPIPFL